MSTSSPNDVPSAAHPWRVRIFGVLWKVFGSLGALFLSLLGAWFLGTIPANSPFVWLFTYWPITLSVGASLLVLAAVIWFYSQEQPRITITQQNRDIMIRRLRLYYSQLKEQSLQGATWLELGFSSKSTAVQQTSTLILQLPNLPEQELAPGTKILDIYDEAGHTLLVLGEPGAGKSTLLLELAQHLIERAEKDILHPLPMIVPLSSWAVKRLPLQDWLNERVTLIYDVPQRLSRQWVQDEQVLVLLDGLDEVEVSLRSECIEKINAYYHQHLQPLVVCSRTTEYEAASQRERLALNSAVVVQPLTTSQVDAYLVQMGKPVADLCTALRKNPTLAALATTPLMLHILMLCYHGISVRQLSQKASLLREQIWTDYVQRMVKRKGDAQRYPLNQTIAWLSRLAQQMQQHDQTIFYLEQLQPDWLPERWLRYIYAALVCSIIGFVSGLVFWLIVWSIFGLTTGIAAGLIGALIGGLGIGWILNKQDIRPAEVLTWSWRGVWRRRNLAIILGVGLGTGLAAGLAAEQSGDQYGLPGGTLFGLISALIVVLVSGVSKKTLDKRKRLRPNEGIRRSARRSRLAWLLGTLSIWLSGGLISALGGGLVRGLGGGLKGGLLRILLCGPIVGLVCALCFGGLACVQHVILRILLWRAGCTPHPWNYLRFLDDATTRILLERVGGGYSFIHRLLLVHFADLNTGQTPAPTTPPPALGHPPSPTTPSI